MTEIRLYSGEIALIDDEDLIEVTKYKWSYMQGYATAGIKKDGKWTSLRMHRLILNLDFGDNRVIDHINHNTLDNRKSNLRICSVAQNSCNRKLNKNSTSGYKGVHLQKSHKTYSAKISVNGKQMYLGSFKSAKEAAKAYNIAALEHHGDFARLNIIID